MSTVEEAGAGMGHGETRVDLRFAHGIEPYRELEALRSRCPVAPATSPEGNPVHAVFGYEQVRQVLTDDRFALDRDQARPGVWTGYGMPKVLEANLLNRDGVDHSRLRKVGAHLFTPGAVEAMTPMIRSLAELSVSGATAVFDAVVDLAEPVSIGVLAHLFGVDSADWGQQFLEWIRLLLDPEPESRARHGEVIGELTTFFAERAAASRVNPADDLPTAAVRALESGLITEFEMQAVLFSHWFAGAENTLNMIGHLVVRVLTEPGLAGRLAVAHWEDPLWDAVVDETLRLDGSVMLSIRRFPIREVEMGGVELEVGRPVLACLAAANRDPARFEDPDAFRPGRAGSHLAFGAGPHYCPGIHLARVELKAAMAALLITHPAARLAVQASQLPLRPSVRTRGYAAVPVAVG